MGIKEREGKKKTREKESGREGREKKNEGKRVRLRNKLLKVGPIYFSKN
jgi:hypothetical protein